MSESRNYKANSTACNESISRSDGGQLSPRLAAVAAFVPAGRVVADVGSGHGLLARRLACRAEGAVARVIASDISPEERAGRLESDPRLPIEYRIGAGLDVLTPEDGVESLIIAGMGARLMLRILERGLPRLPGVRQLVLQPQTEAAAVRAGLARLGWCRIRERLIRDRGRFYLVMAAERGGSIPEPPSPLTADDQWQAGPDLLRTPTATVRDYWKQQARRWERIHAGRGSPHALARLAQARRILAFLPSRPSTTRPLL